MEAADWPTPELASELVRQISVHDAVEREHLYPLARRRLQQGNASYSHWIAEHGEIATALAEIDRGSGQNRLRRDELQRLVRLVRTHVAEEEGSLLPALRAHLSQLELSELGERIRAAKSKAPTHPHPHVAGTGLGARLSRLVSGPLDRARDAVSARG